MLIRVSDSAVTPALVRALEAQAHFVVQRQADDHVAVGVLGSFADGGEMELVLFLAAWQKAHPDVVVELVEH